MFTLGKQSFWRNVTPGAAVRDFATLWRENPYRWRVLAISIALTSLMIYGFLPDNVRAPPAKAQITYISTFEPGRTDAQIIASNIENQKVKEKNAAIEAEHEALRKQFYRELGRASGFDVDALERQYSDKPAEKAQTGARADNR
ncbi:MAG TPA: hypothetical protein VL100_01675 [Croceibacterium sp.]|nr:hypothetical protein [Croceibacterium sp.]